MDRAFLTELRRIVGDSNVLDDALELLTYECDALPHLRETPAAVALPSSAVEVQEIVRLCARAGVPFVARGHGTGLSGGALPVAGGLVIALARLNRVLDVDIPNQRVTVEPGVTNLDITTQVAPFGYYYAPDPSSQQVCSIGGNVAENSGGAHCLKYGFTVHHVLGIEAVLPNGELVQIGGSLADTPGPDLLGLLVGSEGTLAVVTSVIVRILRRPETVQTLLAAFDTIDAGGAVVSDIIGAGIIPAAVEMMDALVLDLRDERVRGAEQPCGQVVVRLRVLPGPDRRRCRRDQDGGDDAEREYFPLGLHHERVLPASSCLPCAMPGGPNPAITLPAHGCAPVASISPRIRACTPRTPCATGRRRSKAARAKTVETCTMVPPVSSQVRLTRADIAN